jgi:hypothetical protein
MNFINHFLTKKTNNYIGFEDMKVASENPHKYIIINTMGTNEQDCLIKNTMNIMNEEKVINDLIDNYEIKKKKIVIYGKNCQDESVENKSKQLQSLGFSHIYIYMGGLFEWMLLQDIYGSDEFKTTTHVLDILKYKPTNVFT